MGFYHDSSLITVGGLKHFAGLHLSQSNGFFFSHALSLLTSSGDKLKGNPLKELNGPGDGPNRGFTILTNQDPERATYTTGSRLEA